MKLKWTILTCCLAIVFGAHTNAQTDLQFEAGFTTIDNGGIAYLPNTGNLAIIDQQGGGGGGGPTRLFIYTTNGILQQIVTLSEVGLAAGEGFLNDGLADLPNGNLIVLTTLGNVVEIDPASGMIVAGGYGGFNVLTPLGAGAETAGFAYNSATDNLWVIDDQGNPFDTLTEFDSSGAIVSGPFFALPGNLNGDAQAVSFLPGLQTMFVAEDDTHSLIEITPAGGFVQTLSVAAISQGSGLVVDPQGIAVDFAGGRMFISNKTANDGNVMVFSIVPDFVLGDINGDGFVDLLDVAPFVDLLAIGGFQDEADINQDGTVDLLDVGPFVALLTGN